MGTISGAFRTDRQQQTRKVSRRRREQAAQLVALAEHLPPEQGALVTAVYDRGMGLGEMARVMQVPTHVIRSRLNRIVRRLGTPLYRYVAARRGEWARELREVADLVVLRGVSQREAARRLGVSVHRVRQEVMRLRVLSEKEPG